MRILLVEDEVQYIEEISPLLSQLGATEIISARSRDSAVERLTCEKDFDLIVCDLNIPTQESGTDQDIRHGFYVHDLAKKYHPGTPSIFLSAYVNMDNVRSRLITGHSVDLFGNGEQWPTIDVRRKRHQREFLSSSARLAEGISSLESVEVETPHGLQFSRYALRPMRVYARRVAAERIKLDVLSGLSGALVFRCQAMGTSGSVVAEAVAKVDLISKIRAEIDAYERFVASGLEIGGFAPLTGQVLYGCGRYGSVFYGLAGEGYRDLFDLIEYSAVEATDAVCILRSNRGRWLRPPQQEPEVSLRDLRVPYISDSELDNYIGAFDEASLRNVEETLVRVTTSVQHGDLHGKNILVSQDGNPLLIDYADVDILPSVLDPVTLELSLLFHRDHPGLGEWPSLERAKNWFDLSAYAGDSPIHEVIRACRRWATAVGTELEVASIVYTQAMRQLKYPDTDKELAITIVKASIEAMRTLS